MLSLLLREAPLLVRAESAIIWPWDADQRSPVMMRTLHGTPDTFTTPAPLLDLFRMMGEDGAVQAVGAAFSDDSWPAEMAHRPFAVIPLMSPQGCLAFLTVQRERDGSAFASSDLQLLFSLVNTGAIALQRAKPHPSERWLIDLLQTSIRHVVRASSGQAGQLEEFLQAMAHVAEGLTRAQGVCVRICVSLERLPEPFLASSGVLATGSRDLLRQIGDVLCTFDAEHAPAPTGALTDLPLPADVESWPQLHYAAVEMQLDGKLAGWLFAVHNHPLSNDQCNFLRTIADLIGEGLRNVRQAENIQRLLFELSNVIYVAEEITRTFDPRKIAAVISEAAARALNVPVAFSGRRRPDGMITIDPLTAVGLTPESWARVHLSENNAAIKEVLRLLKPITSRSNKKRERDAFKFLHEQGLQDWLCVPMVAQPRTPNEAPHARGVVLVADTHLRAFTDHEIALLSTYANQAALAFENAQLMEEKQRQLLLMEKTYVFTRDIHPVEAEEKLTLDIRGILNLLMCATTQAVQAPAALIALTDDETGAQHAECSLGVESMPLASLRWQPGEGIIGTVAQRGEPIISVNLASDGRDPQLRELAMKSILSSSVTVPLQAESSLLGTLTVFTTETRTFTHQEDMQPLQTMATEAAAVIQNVRKRLREKHGTDELKALVKQLLQRTPATLQLLLELLDILPAATRPAHELLSMRAWLEVLLAVQQEVTNETPQMVNVKNALKHLTTQRRQRDAWPYIEVNGPGVMLPLPEGQALALFILEWLRTLLAEPGAAETEIKVAFQQTGQEMSVQIEDKLPSPPAIPAPLLAWMQRRLPGALTETTRQGTHLVHYRFLAP